MSTAPLKFPHFGIGCDLAFGGATCWCSQGRLTGPWAAVAEARAGSPTTALLTGTSKEGRNHYKRQETEANTRGFISRIRKNNTFD